VDHHAIAYEPGSTSNVWVGNDGGCWRSTDDGTFFQVRNTGLVTYQFYDVCVNRHPATPHYILGGTQDNGTDRWSGGVNWANGLHSDGMVCNISRTDGTTVYAETQNGTHYRNDTSGVGAWSPINAGITGTGLWLTPVADDAHNGAHLYTSTSDGIFRTTDSGASWTLVSTERANWLSVSPVNGDLVWALVGGSIRYSSDDGSTWQAAAPFPFAVGGSRRVQAHPLEEGTVFATFSGYSSTAHLAVSTDFGATWTNVTGDLPDQPVNDVEVDADQPGIWYIGTDTGVWRSENGGANWMPFDDGLPNAVVGDIELVASRRKLLAGTYGRGAWEADVPLASTAAVEGAPALGSPLLLDAPFPNPTGDRAVLRFAARGDGTVALDVFDVAGRRVSHVASLPRADGIVRSVSWLVDDVADGVYFAVLQAGDRRLSRRIVVRR